MALELEITSLLDRLYRATSFEEGGEPDWQALRDVFSKHARVTRVTPEGTDYLDVDGFLALTRNQFELGAYTSCYELELAHTTESFGEIAQVWSMVETRRSRTACVALNRCLNSIQLIREGPSWRVLNMLRDEVNAAPGLRQSEIFGD